MSEDLSQLKEKKIMGLVYDVPKQLENSKFIHFPEDAMHEWENQKTLDTIVYTWQSLGFQVVLFPLNQSFLKQWEKHISSCDLIHSVVEGFGSLAREAWIPSLCELSGVPYIGSSPFAHSLCMSKMQLKQTCAQLNIPTAPFYFIQSQEDLLSIDPLFFLSPVFLKPNAEGSGMGIDALFSICSTENQTKQAAIELLKKYPEGILIEKYLQGPEYSSALIGTPTQFLPIAQIEVASGVYGALAKGKEKMEEQVSFPNLSLQVRKIIEDGSYKLFSAIPLHDFVRIDWKCDENGQVYFLEANTLAGLSHHYSVLPLMAKEAGIDYKKLFEILAHSAFTRAQGRHLWYGKTRIQKR
jgi:D-alanine-D-alanine ligase